VIVTSKQGRGSAAPETTVGDLVLERAELGRQILALLRRLDRIDRLLRSEAIAERQAKSERTIAAATCQIGGAR